MLTIQTIFGIVMRVECGHSNLRKVYSSFLHEFSISLCDGAHIQKWTQLVHFG